MKLIKILLLFATVIFTKQFQLDAFPCHPKGAHGSPVAFVHSYETNKFEISWFAQNAYEKGGEAYVKRCVGGRLLTVAKGEILGANGPFLYAKVENSISNSTFLGETTLNMANLGNGYWLPMVGDLVTVPTKDILEQPVVQGQWIGDASVLFEQPYKDIELTPIGRKMLNKAFENHFLGKSGNLVVEGFVNKPGNRHELLLVSQGWAQAVSQYLRSFYDLDFDRVVTLSIGNDGYSQDTQQAGVSRKPGGIRLYLSNTH